MNAVVKEKRLYDRGRVASELDRLRAGDWRTS
jgi:hypothetical protein